MKILKIKKLGKQTLTIEKGSDWVEGCFRKVVFTDLRDNEDYDITLTGGDALVPLTVGQHVLADLRCDHFKFYNEWKDEYYIISIKPLENNYETEYHEDWTTRLV